MSTRGIGARLPAPIPREYCGAGLRTALATSGPATTVVDDARRRLKVLRASPPPPPSLLPPFAGPPAPAATGAHEAGPGIAPGPTGEHEAGPGTAPGPGVGEAHRVGAVAPPPPSCAVHPPGPQTSFTEDRVCRAGVWPLDLGEHGTIQPCRNGERSWSQTTRARGKR